MGKINVFDILISVVLVIFIVVRVFRYKNMDNKLKVFKREVAINIAVLLPLLVYGFTDLSEFLKGFSDITIYLVMFLIPCVVVISIVIHKKLRIRD
ncbi:hypothetical protein PRVXH_002158 [Proteinivorax hydrogeniformans]|uniref:Uncharacterized protein n=1 Tax=Proteinivorax hydrogeniformans TaxID=1826727 RepID=A0AAU8HSW6_9FIRM